MHIKHISKGAISTRIMQQTRKEERNTKQYNLLLQATTKPQYSKATNQSGKEVDSERKKERYYV